MADTDHNPQYSSSFFGLDGSAYASTGAPGSAGDTAQQTTGQVIGTPDISVPYASSQVPQNHPSVAVTSGDTSGMSSDSPVGDNFAKLSSQPAAGMLATGAGQGTAEHLPHPNAAGRGGA